MVFEDVWTSMVFSGRWTWTVFLWTFGLKWFFQGRVLRVFQGLVLLVVSRIRILDLVFLDLDFKELGFRQNPLGFEDKRKKEVD